MNFFRLFPKIARHIQEDLGFCTKRLNFKQIPKEEHDGREIGIFRHGSKAKKTNKQFYRTVKVLRVLECEASPSTQEIDILRVTLQ
jgi:hypothetical protein